MPPTEIMVFWKAMGAASFKSCPASPRWKVNSPFWKRSGSSFSTAIRQITVATPWAMTVAAAAPITLQWNTTTNSRSRAMFVTEAATMAISGERESPSARGREEGRL